MRRFIAPDARPYACRVCILGVLLLLASCGGGSSDTSSDPSSSDSMPPTAPANLVATAASSGQIDLAWDAATDDVGVTGYDLERCNGASCSPFAQIAATSGTGTLFSDTSVAASTSYSYRVRATDAASNLSGYSNITTALTPAPSTPVALFTDDFDRANLGANWLNSGAQGGAIVGNQLTGGAAVCVSGTCDNFIFVTSVSPPANQYAKITFVSTANPGSGLDLDNGGPMVRGTANGDGWLFDWISNKTMGNSTWTLFRVLKDVGTPITTGSLSRALIPGDVIEIRAVGNVITGYLNGNVVAGSATTDATYPTGGFGMHLFSNTGMWDNFEGGSL